MTKRATFGRGITLMDIATDGTDPLFAAGSRSRSDRLLGEVLKHLRAMLTDGADVVFGKRLTLVDIAADGALPALFG